MTTLKVDFSGSPMCWFLTAAGLPASILFGHGRMRRKDED